MRQAPFGYGALMVVAAAMLAGFATPPLAPAGGAISPLEMAAGLRRLTFSMNPALLKDVQVEADEIWTPAAPGDPPETERDAVSFYRSVPVEVQQTDDDRPLDAGAVRNQKKLARELEGMVDKALAGGDDEAGRLLDLDGDVWTLDKFQAHFAWTGERGPLLEGRPTLRLHFTPAAGIHPNSRLARLLSRTAGEIETDAQTGQILAGNFHSLGAVKFGAGVLADISFFDGRFTMQPVSTPQGECWVMRQAVVRVRSRELFHHSNGTESITYNVLPEPADQPLH